MPPAPSHRPQPPHTRSPGSFPEGESPASPETARGRPRRRRCRRAERRPRGRGSSRRLPTPVTVCYGNGAGSRGRYSHARKEREAGNGERRRAAASGEIAGSHAARAGPSRRRGGERRCLRGAGREPRAAPVPFPVERRRFGALAPGSAPREAGRKLLLSLRRWRPALRWQCPKLRWWSPG